MHRLRALLGHEDTQACMLPAPPGRLRPYRPAPLSRWASTWAKPAYRHLYDPDGRPATLRRNNAF